MTDGCRDTAVCTSTMRERREERWLDNAGSGYLMVLKVDPRSPQEAAIAACR